MGEIEWNEANSVLRVTLDGAHFRRLVISHAGLTFHWVESDAPGGAPAALTKIVEKGDYTTVDNSAGYTHDMMHFDKADAARSDLHSHISVETSRLAEVCEEVASLLCEQDVFTNDEKNWCLNGVTEFLKEQASSSSDSSSLGVSSN